MAIEGPHYTIKCDGCLGESRVHASHLTDPLDEEEAGGYAEREMNWIVADGQHFCSRRCYCNTTRKAITLRNQPDPQP